MDYASYFPFWRDLTQSQQQLLSTAIHKKQFERGTIIHNGSNDCVGLLLVLCGQIRVYTISEEGKEVTLYRLFERDMCLFSASCIMQSIQFDVTVSAQQNTEVLMIAPDVYKQLMRQSAAVSNYTNELMASHFSDVMWLMDQVMNKKLDTRLAAFLLEESELADTDRLSITHEQIANHLGNVREVISRMLKYFQNESLVKLGRGTITIMQPDKLAQLAQASLR